MMQDGTDYIELFREGTAITVQAYISLSEVLYITGGTITINQWHHVRVVRNNTTFTLYVDGVAVGTDTDSNTFGGTSWTLTVGNGYTSGFWQGQIDEFLILDQICLGRGKPTAALAPVASSYWNDTFDDSSLDTAKWTTSTAGTNSISETIVLSLSAGTSGGNNTARLISAVSLGSDDFDVRLDFENLSQTAGLTTNAGIIHLRAVLPSGNHDIAWGTDTTNGGHYYYRDSGTKTIVPTTVPSSGYLRLQRVGTSLYHYTDGNLRHTSTVSGSATECSFQCFASPNASSSFDIPSFTITR
jgi:hypothetical protein